MGNVKRAAARLLLSGLLTVGAAIVADVVILDSHAIAAAGGGGNGEGNSGNGNGNGGPSEGPSGGSGGNNGNDKGVGNGAIASAAGSLNAAKASPNARANAATNSTVGQIALFEQARLAQIAERDQALADQEAALETLEALEAIQEVLDDPTATQPAKDAALMSLTDDFGLTEADLADAIAAAEIAYGTAATNAAAKQEALDDMSGQIAALEPAANKDVTASVVEAVKGWLGLSE